MNKLTCTLDDIFEFSKLQKLDNNIKVNTRFGYKAITNVAITAKNSKVIKICTNSTYLKTSPDHLLFSNNKWIKVKKLKVGDSIKTRTGSELITKIKYLDQRQDLYDLEVDEVKEFYANDIVSHNSSISDVIKFGIYGKIGSKRIGDIPNRFNNATLVKIEIQQNNDTKIIIERGISPTYVKLWINSNGNSIEYDQAGKKNVDLYIEEEIIGLPFYVFNNIISLSINDFKSFLKMSPNDKRAIVDKIFDLELINTVRTLIKEEMKNIKDNIYFLEKENEILEKQILASNSELGKLKKELSEDIDERKAELIENIEEYSNNVIILKTKIENLKDKEKNAITKINELSDSLSHDIHIQKSIDEKKTLYKNNKCPICESDLTTEFHKQLYQEYLDKEQVLKGSIDKTKETLSKLRKIRSKINSTIDTFETQRAEFNFFLQETKNRLSELSKSKNNSKEIAYIQNIINGIKKSTLQSNKNVDIQNNKKNFFRIIDDVFGDKGIKQLAIQKILPTLNAEIQRVLVELSLDYRVIFNSEFEPTILHLGHDVASQQLSTGERKKVDFAILIAMIRLLKIKYHNINLIFLDEIFSSIDSGGIHEILKILSKITKELNMNIFVINHSMLQTEIFDYKIDVTKDTNFSSLKISKQE